MSKIYVLELEGVTETGSKRFYIGKSNNVIDRYLAHCSGTGSTYTKQYKPIYISQIFDAGNDESSALMLEDSITEEYILLHGLGVRGGHYLSEQDVRSFIAKENHLRDACYACGKTGHYSKSCKTKACNEPKFLSSIAPLQEYKIRTTLWSSGRSKYLDDVQEDSKGTLQVKFGAQTHARNKNHEVKAGALYCDTSKGGWTVRGIVSEAKFDRATNVFDLIVKPIAETGLSIRSSPEEHGKIAIAKYFHLPLPSYNWTSSGIVVHEE